MSRADILALLKLETRLRLRRWSTVLALLGTIAVGWALIGDPAAGMTMLASNNARVLYTSSALAMGSAALLGPLLALVGFYLLRGRTAEDVRSGVGGVIAATMVSNRLFLFGRWLGSVAYLWLLVAGFCLAMLACHWLRGDGPILLWTYLQTYLALLAPMVIFTAGCALLFDAISALMGKAGDVLFFFVWVAQLALAASLSGAATAPLSGALLLDFSGMVSGIYALMQQLQTSDISLGATSFDAALPAVMLPAELWSTDLLMLRLGSAALGLIPLLLAMVLFHRYSPDRVRAAQALPRRSPLAFLNARLRPLSRLAQPMNRAAVALPGFAGQVLAEVALTLALAPLAIVIILLAWPAALLMSTANLPALLLALLAFWGVLISDLSTRDYSADTEDFSRSAPGGATQRYFRQFLAAVALALLLMGAIALRVSVHAPAQALAWLVGVLFLSALASLLGRSSRAPRTFLALFLFGLYVALNAREMPLLDVVGFNGVANSASIALYLALAIAALGLGYLYQRQAAR